MVSRESYNEFRDEQDDEMKDEMLYSDEDDEN